MHIKILNNTFIDYLYSPALTVMDSSIKITQHGQFSPFCIWNIQMAKTYSYLLVINIKGQKFVGTWW